MTIIIQTRSFLCFSVQAAWLLLVLVTVNKMKQVCLLPLTLLKVNINLKLAVIVPKFSVLLMGSSL